MSLLSALHVNRALCSWPKTKKLIPSVPLRGRPATAAVAVAMSTSPASPSTAQPRDGRVTMREGYCIATSGVIESTRSLGHDQELVLVTAAGAALHPSEYQATYGPEAHQHSGEQLDEPAADVPTSIRARSRSGTEVTSLEACLERAEGRSRQYGRPSRTAPGQASSRRPRPDSCRARRPAQTGNGGRSPWNMGKCRTFNVASSAPCSSTVDATRWSTRPMEW